MKYSKTKYANVYIDEAGRFLYRIQLGTNPITGKRVQRNRYKDANGTPFNTAYAAYKEVIRVKKSFLDANNVADSSLTYEAFVQNVYLPFYKSDVKPQTFLSTKPAIDKSIERFRDKKLNSFTVRDAESYRVFLLAETDYSSAYAGKIYHTFRKILDYAVSLNYLASNISKRTRSIPKVKPKVSFWTKTDFEKVIQTFFLDDYYEHMSFIMIWVYFMTGIRVSEGLALTWKDINFNSKQLSITHSLTRLNADDVKIFGELKTISSERIISLDDDTIVLLKDWKTIQKAHGAHSLVMSYNDKPLYRSTVARIIKRHAQLAHVPVIEGKGLRHSHVSYLINEFNADVLLVSKRLGHSDPSITLTHYAHLWRTGDQQLTDKMTGNIQINTAKSKLVHFNGNQHIRKK